MNDIYSNKIDMYIGIQAWLKNHAAQTITIPAIAPVEVEFNQTLTDIFKSAGQINAKITGYAKDKANRRAELTTSIMQISTAFTAWAMLNGNADEGAKFNKSIAALKALADAKIFTYAQTLHTYTLPLLPQLGTYGLLAAHFTQLATAATAFGQAINEPKNAITHRKNQGILLIELIKKQDLMLKEKLDKLILILGVSDNSLLHSYKNMRNIIDR